MQVTTRLTTGLALLLCASVAGADDRSAYETSEQGWSTAHSCIEDQERDAKQCWTQTRGHSASGRFEASLMYVCWDHGAEKLLVWFQWTKGQASTESEPVLSVKWDDGTEQLLETISESRRKKKLSSKWIYRYVVKPERAPAFPERAARARNAARAAAVHQDRADMDELPSTQRHSVHRGDNARVWH